MALIKYGGGKNKSNKKYIIWVIVCLIVLFIFIIFVSKIFKINSNTRNTKSNSIEKYAICSKNSNTINYIQGNTEKTYIKHIFHSEGDVLGDTLCTTLKIMAYNYDVSADVICGNQDFYANYYRQDSFDNIINDITNKQEFNCLVYDDKENVEKNKIVGSWCGYRYDDTTLKYKFNKDGTIEETYTFANYKGFYNIENNSISYGIFMANADYYMPILDNHFIYDENSDTLILTSKWKNDKYNVFSRCD